MKQNILDINELNEAATIGGSDTPNPASIEAVTITLLTIATAVSIISAATASCQDSPCCS